MIKIGNKPHVLAPTIPANVFMIYQWLIKYLKLRYKIIFFSYFSYTTSMFAAISPCLAFGSAAERTTVKNSKLIFL